MRLIALSDGVRWVRTVLGDAEVLGIILHTLPMGPAATSILWITSRAYEQLAGTRSRCVLDSKPAAFPRTRDNRQNA